MGSEGGYALGMDFEHRWLGRIGYDEAHALQRALLAERAEGRGRDTLLTLEHDPVMTLGRNADPSHLLLAAGHAPRRSRFSRASGAQTPCPERSLPRSPCAILTPHAGVAQLVERLLPKQKVASSSLVSRSSPSRNTPMRQPRRRHLKGTMIPQW